MSDVELLREAAKVMRERADAATPGPWQADDSEIYGETPGVWVGETLRVDAADATGANSAHIASWHPDVALAVADWLDWTAPHMAHHIKAWSSPHAITKGERELVGQLVEDHFGRALAVARAYLGRQP